MKCSCVLSSVAAFAGSLSVIALSMAADPPPKYEITAKRGAVAVAEEGRRLVVTSEFGIGTAQIRLAEGSWPGKLTILLKLKELEGLTIQNDRLELRTNRKAQFVEVREKQGDVWKEVPAKPEQRITVRGEPGKIEVEIPSILLRTDVRQLDIQWVDYYRG